MYLVLSISQVDGNGDSFIQFLWSHDLREPRGAHVLVVDVAQRVGVQVQPQHSVVGGVVHTVWDAVSVNSERVWYIHCMG